VGWLGWVGCEIWWVGLGWVKRDPRTRMSYILLPPTVWTVVCFEGALDPNLVWGKDRRSLGGPN